MGGLRSLRTGSSRVKRLALLGVSLLAGCELFRPPPAILEPEWPQLETSDFGEMQNVSMSGGLWFGGGVTEGDVKLAFRRGVKHILDLSFDGDEVGFDLKEACASNGIELIDAGLVDAESLGGDERALVLEVFRDRERHPLLVVCEAGSTSAAYFALWRILDHEMPIDVALDEARRAGMRPGTLEEYVRAQAALLGRED